MFLALAVDATSCCFQLLDPLLRGHFRRAVRSEMSAVTFNALGRGVVGLG